MLDSVLREYDNTARIENTTIIQFYADDGFIASPDPTITQHTLNALLHNFSTFGLCINTTKTESMTMLGSKLIHRISDTAYTRMITKNGPTCEDRRKKKNQLYKLWVGGSNQIIKTTSTIKKVSECWNGQQSTRLGVHTHFGTTIRNICYIYGSDNT
jgi:hypothetical protein